MANAPEFKSTLRCSDGQRTILNIVADQKTVISLARGLKGAPRVEGGSRGIDGDGLNAAFCDVSRSCCVVLVVEQRGEFCRPQGRDNDKYVALTFLRNSGSGIKGTFFPFCPQDTGTAHHPWRKRPSRCGPVIATKRLCRKVSIRLIPKETCVTAGNARLSMFEG